MIVNYGSKIIFDHIYFSTKMKYQCIASTTEIEPEKIIIHSNDAWFTKNENYLQHLLIKILSHEPIHQILWKFCLDPKGTFDLVRIRFIRKIIPELDKKERQELRRIF